MKIAITSAYANPLHPGHVECFELSKNISDEVWVIINNDHQAKLKRGTESFQDEQFRARLVASLKAVDRVIIATDVDGSVCATLRTLLEEIKLRPEITEVIFTKGGDRFAHEIPEAKVLAEYGVQIVDSLGAKIYSSSSYVTRASNAADSAKLKEKLETIPKQLHEQEYIEIGYRPWGVYYVLEDKPSYKVKKIIVEAGQRLSLQSHEHRSEHWVVVDGTATVLIRRKEDPDYIGQQILEANQSCYIPKGNVHRLSNYGTTPLVIIEVQTGSYTGEDDIVRYADDYQRDVQIPTETTS